MNIDVLEKILKETGQPRFRQDQIIKAVYQDSVLSFAEISNLPKDLRKILDEKIKIMPFEAKKVSVSAYKDSVKALLKLADGNLIETVLLSPKPGTWSVCISCQAGCPLGCVFCATGRAGFKRNLTAEEITEQVLFWKQYVKKNKITDRINDVVYMGMGEPFLNWKEVSDSLKILNNKKYFNIGSRSISVSTSGVSGGIEKLAKDFPQVNLAVSLHFSDNLKRTQYMPVNKNFNLNLIRDSIEKYLEKTKRKIFIEYILFNGLNDKEEDAKNLAGYIKSFKLPHLLHVNLIRYNSKGKKEKKTAKGSNLISSCDLNPSETRKAVWFKNFLLNRKISCTIRKSLGSDIQGACGQLAGK